MIYMLMAITVILGAKLEFAITAYSTKEACEQRIEKAEQINPNFLYQCKEFKVN